MPNSPVLPSGSEARPAQEAAAAEGKRRSGAVVQPQAPTVRGADSWEVGPFGQHLEDHRLRWSPSPRPGQKLPSAKFPGFLCPVLQAGTDRPQPISPFA